ncbi:YfiH family protein [Bifidobacterium commune]|uniref:YfiH family protein n=1 Tax=Bifidobacterium commune TaxID=1505727 RepID=A0A1C4H525_9BIFI|nr:polyphenol oxidase family protein [Bifidobacterium commune]MBB2955808.1 YfiH family protein [Bifidobacterium commune]SCC79891.1 YfiH family protein [Bifidobacterium commune]
MSKDTNETGTSGQYEEVILDSNAIAPTDSAGNLIPVTIPVDLAPGIKVVYTTRLGGVSVGDWGNFNLGGKSGDSSVAVESNREALSKVVGAPLSLVKQVHSGKAVDADDYFDCSTPYGCDRSGTVVEGQDGQSEEGAIEADAQVSAQTGVAVGVFAADCLPVLLADPQAGVVAAAHCGRKGLRRGIIRATVELMVSKGAKPERIITTLGPCICGDCYEVGDEIADEFDAQFLGTFTLTRFGGPGIDISGAALQELAEVGVPRDNIIDSMPRIQAATQYLDQDTELAALCACDGEGSPDLVERMSKVRHSRCTLENPLWYSHRRASLVGKGNEGRLLAVIVRE